MTANDIKATTAIAGGVLRPVEPGPGIRIHLGSDRQLAVEHWLMAAHPHPGDVREEWEDHQVALLPLGGLFSAVRIPGDLVTALAHGRSEPSEVDPWLARQLEGGPVICDRRATRRYYVLVPAGMSRSWRPQITTWGVEDVDVLGRDSYLGVPRPGAGPERDTYWAVPMASAGELCTPLLVARLVAAGRHRLTELDRTTP